MLETNKNKNLSQSFKKLTVSRFFALVILIFSFSFNSFSQEVDIAKGKSLFNANCAACHKLNKNLIGPALAGVSAKYEKEWLYTWIKNSNAMIKSGDERAVAIWEEWNKAAMNAFPQLSNMDIDNILAYTDYVPEPVAVASTAVPSAQAPTAGSVSTDIVLAILILVLCILLTMLFMVNKTLKAIAIKNGVKFEDPKPLFKVPVWKLFIKNQFLVFCSVIAFLLSSAYFAYGWMMQIGIDQGYMPVQPIHYSHKIHSGANQIECQYCHSSVRSSKHSGIPSLNVCMNCHQNIAEYNGEEVRIHNLPDFVYFNHSQHVNVGGIDCKECHGPIEEMEIVYQHSSLTMGWCINCHRESEVNVKSNEYYTKIHEELSKKYGVEKLTVAQMGGLECGKCHY